jgi:predicted DNA-binding transcriptional regulator YafY
MAARGSALTHSRLTPEIVRAIRDAKNLKTAKQLSEEFGVHHRTIEKVRYYETWSHVK